MKTLVSLFVIIFMFMTAGIANAASTGKPAAANGKNGIVLTSRDVKSAIDIENAIHVVTNNGTQAGIITFDGSNGPFVYTGNDRSINIFYSNLTFRGVKNAIFTNTDDGFFFDDTTTDNIRIEGLFMASKGGGIAGTGHPKNVIVRGNTFRADRIAIGVNRGTNWIINGNTILAGFYAIQIVGGSSRVTISDNVLSAPIGIIIEGIGNSKVYNNTIQALYQGISMNGESHGNEVYKNQILGTQLSGLYLQPGVINNRVSGNKVLCGIDTECKTVEAAPEVIKMNRISNNLP